MDQVRAAAGQIWTRRLRGRDAISCRRRTHEKHETCGKRKVNTLPKLFSLFCICWTAETAEAPPCNPEPPGPESSCLQADWNQALLEVEQSSTATREEWKKRGGHRPTKHRRRSQSELFAAVGRHTACESTFMDDWSCMCKEMQAANDRTTKRCFPSTAQRPSNRTGHRTQRLLLHAASLISALTCDRASCTQNGKGDGSLTPLPHHHHDYQLLLTQSTAYFNFTDIQSWNWN